MTIPMVAKIMPTIWSKETDSLNNMMPIKEVIIMVPPDMIGTI